MSIISKPWASGLQAHPGLRAKRVWIWVLRLHLLASGPAVYFGMPLTHLSMSVLPPVQDVYTLFTLGNGRL